MRRTSFNWLFLTYTLLHQGSLLRFLRKLVQCDRFGSRFKKPFAMYKAGSTVGGSNYRRRGPRAGSGNRGWHKVQYARPNQV